MMKKKYRILFFSTVFLLSLYVVWVFLFALPFGNAEKRAYLNSSRNRILLAVLDIQNFHKEQNRFPVSLQELSSWSKAEYLISAPPIGSLRCRLFVDDGSPTWYRVLFPLVYEQEQNREQAAILYNPPSTEPSMSPEGNQTWALLSPFVCKEIQLGGKVRWGVSKRDLVQRVNNPVGGHEIVKDFYGTVDKAK